MKHVHLTQRLAIAVLLLATQSLALPLLASAANDVQVTDTSEFQLLTADTSVATTITVSSGGQATFFDVPTNYIDITLDSSSALTFNVSTPNRFFKITKQSGSNNFTVSPSCPTNSVTLKGTGAQVVVRLQIVTTNSCPKPGGGGGGSYHPTLTPSPTASPFPTPTGQLTPTPIPTAGPLPTPVPSRTPAPTQIKYTSPVIVTVFARDLSQGMSGRDVTAVQQVLAADKAVYPEGLVNGYFGAATTRAVKRLQAKYGFPQTGVVDRQTRIKLAAIAKTIRIPVTVSTAKGPSKVKPSGFIRIRLQ